MNSTLSTIRVGQFSESPILAVASALGLAQKYGVTWETQRVPSSPGQFGWLRDGEIDVAITSPDNVLLYATTDQNPLGQQLDTRLLRPIDRGLGLALYTDARLEHLGALRGSTLGVDVLNSGFALLLLRMLKDAGVDASTIAFEAVGATPKRLGAITDGLVVGTILNAETAVAAEELGLRRWVTSADVSPDYLGTVLVQAGRRTTEAVERFLALWDEAATGLREIPELAARMARVKGDVRAVLSEKAP